MGQGQSSIPTTEVKALVELYDTLNGDRWRRRDGWKQLTRDPEQWFGVEVSMGHVVALELPANNLSGCLPGGSLERLPTLLVLDLSKNQLQGEIPTEVEKLSMLKRLYLSYNDLTGAIPTRIGDCSSLQELHLYENSLSGTMPMELGKLQNMRTLQLQHNNLCGALPDTLCELIQLSKVSLSGPIPESLGKLENLEYLYLIDNALESRVPGSIARLKFLKESDFRDNRLCGELPNFLDGCSILEAAMTEWKNRKASYSHAPLGDLMASFNMVPTSTHQFLQTLEDPPSNPSTIILSQNFGHKTSAYDEGFLENDFGNNSFLITIFLAKTP
ncbi:hypothetical protein PsorP6_002308 [Peronosclerospora sorghi]|uniref:Uncharacterized protein n=1 Tax=Peronosclerospora sorghi TaxID=230839 RepID=A0ACC0WRF9_9STRA|nr:hypothetical protein PsorP6_002308 [Peronosclerospora sorghi]